MEGLRACEEKMRAEGVPDVAIATFAHYYRQLARGESGTIPDAEIEPPGELPAHADLPADEEGARSALDETVVIKLNGGLGTSMGMTRAKSLLPVKDGLTFLDVIVGQTLELRRAFGARLPLVLMNSFYTREDSLAALARHPEIAEQDVPLDFVQNKQPKVLVDSLEPVSWPDDPALEWCPPGHGDLYTALVTSGMLGKLRDRGYRYAFVGNADNLGAVLDLRILAWFAREEVPFLMEVAERTEADRKGGHLARRRDGGLVLRELAQTPPEDGESFQDTARWRWFNANTLWVDLRALEDVLRERDHVLGLPMIRNRKTVDPGDPTSPAVYQLETAMGAAIGVFEGARALRVGRERFAPVKTTNDLLGLRSDAYVITDEYRVVVSPDRSLGPLFVDLDPEYYKLVRDFDARFPAGPPSLVDCARFVVRGDVTFGRDVVARGEVEVAPEGPGPHRIEDGTVLGG